jgi:hypothetical protein
MICYDCFLNENIHDGLSHYKERVPIDDYLARSKDEFETAYLKFTNNKLSSNYSKLIDKHVSELKKKVKTESENFKEKVESIYQDKMSNIFANQDQLEKKVIHLLDSQLEDLYDSDKHRKVTEKINELKEINEKWSKFTRAEQFQLLKKRASLEEELSNEMRVFDKAPDVNTNMTKTLALIAEEMNSVNYDAFLNHFEEAIREEGARLHQAIYEESQEHKRSEGSPRKRS